MSSLMARLKADTAAASIKAVPNPAASPISPVICKARAAPKSIIQQLLQNSSDSNSFKAPPPFFMCSESEALDRQSCLELSPFEYQQPLDSLNSTQQRNNADATWDANEIRLDFSPTPKKSSLSAALSIPPNSAYYSKVSKAYVPPNKRTDTANTPGALMQSSNANTTPMSTAKKASRTRPNFHPQLVIKKYRRSAAGGGVNEQSESARTLDQLNGTVDYLMRLFAHQMPPDVSNNGNAWNQNNSTCDQRQSTLCDTVNFIDDRLRAVQKDLVMLVGDLEDSSSGTNITLELENGEAKTILRKMQAKMVRYNILALYLLSEVPADKFQVKFGAVALRTCFTSYLNLSRSLHDEYNDQNDAFVEELRTQDEIMSYVALFHMSAVLRSEETALPPPSSSSVSSSLLEESGCGWGALFSTFAKYVVSCEKKGSRLVVDLYPRWRWTIELASSAQTGNYQRYFDLLEHGPTYSTNAYKTHHNARFLILARCCCSSSLNLARLSQLRRYNHAFGKGEKVPAENLARLLRFGDNNCSEEALAVKFCRDAGLPIIDDADKCHVTMKAAPIDVSGDESISRISNPGRTNDSFVFGAEFENEVSLLANRFDAVHVDESIDYWEERDTNAISLDETEESTDCVNCIVDLDGVLVPTSSILSSLIE
ncbi:hypothetical protein ACHAWO_003104 [Cyclotella atomus]|uniref:SAC3/GANP/THP3 conserved domain-containing protein n=1 Tax=Cyclotella atomus TaxID=382360 RepID=A0ABD3NPW8_9STRA